MNNSSYSPYHQRSHSLPVGDSYGSSLRSPPSPSMSKACKGNSNPHAVLFGVTTTHRSLSQPNSGI
ncbi:hypothetical protein PHYBLDRAFT_186339, partial [Phycomyces blakesleeanus NRRL 1555(-)]